MAVNERTREMEAELVGLLYTQASPAFVVTFLNAGIITLALWSHVAPFRLITWLALVGVITACRFWCVRHYRRTTTPRSNRVGYWRTLFIMGAGVAGAAWGAAGIFLFPSDSIVQQVFLVFMLGGMAAGAVMTLSSVMSAFFAFYLPTVLPIAARLFFEGGAVHIAMGLPLLAFAAMLVVTARQFHVALITSFQLRFVNLDLVQSLSLAKEQAEQANQQLQESNQALNRMILEVKSSEERFRSLNTASPVGVFQTDTEGRVLYTNPLWQEITGLTHEESLGEDWMEGVAPDDREAVVRAWQTFVCEGYTFSLEFRFCTKRGEARWVQTRIATLYTDSGELQGYVGTVEDITERQAIDQLKNEFVSVVSHELRTPLTSIRGSLGLLASGRLGTLQEKGRRMLDIAVANTDRLVRLINDILDIERIQSGKVAMQKQRCDAADLMNQAVEELRVMAEKAEVRLLVTPQAAQLWADPDRVVQILTNLLSNAIKFSPVGTTVWLSAEPQEGHLRFAVKDQGRGIPADKLESIFERFQQVDASDSREKGGTGLGLAICHCIVQQHGGRIWVESTIGEGSTFFFTLPMLGRAESVSPKFSPCAEQRTILVCDDNPVIGEVLRAMLEYHGYQAVITTSGPDAIHQAVYLRPAAIILDLLMPGMDGWQTAAELKELPETCDIPVIVLSGLSPQEVNDLPTSVSAWLCKPVEREALLHALGHAINGQNKTACILVAEDDVDLAKVIITMLQRHGIESFYARTGREAIQLSQRLSVDLLILDPSMPDGDGFMVVNWCRQQNNLRQVPLVVYSAKDLDVEERERLKLGPTQFYIKGRVTPEEFEQRVVGLLNHILAQRGGEQSNGNQAYLSH